MNNNKIKNSNFIANYEAFLQKSPTSFIYFKVSRNTPEKARIPRCRINIFEAFVTKDINKKIIPTAHYINIYNLDLANKILETYKKVIPENKEQFIVLSQSIPHTDNMTVLARIPLFEHNAIIEELIISLINTEKYPFAIDIRTFMTRPNFVGWTPQGIRFPLDKSTDFINFFSTAISKLSELISQINNLPIINI